MTQQLDLTKKNNRLYTISIVDFKNEKIYDPTKYDEQKVEELKPGWRFTEREPHGRLGYVEVLSDDLKVIEQISDWPIQNLKADLFTVLNRGVAMVINPQYSGGIYSIRDYWNPTARYTDFIVPVSDAREYIIVRSVLGVWHTMEVLSSMIMDELVTFTQAEDEFEYLATHTCKYKGNHYYSTTTPRDINKTDKLNFYGVRLSEEEFLLRKAALSIRYKGCTYRARLLHMPRNPAYMEVRCENTLETQTILRSEYNDDTLRRKLFDILAEQPK